MNSKPQKETSTYSTSSDGESSQDYRKGLPLPPAKRRCMVNKHDETASNRTDNVAAAGVHEREGEKIAAYPGDQNSRSGPFLEKLNQTPPEENEMLRAHKNNDFQEMLTLQNSIDELCEEKSALEREYKLLADEKFELEKQMKDERTDFNQMMQNTIKEYQMKLQKLEQNHKIEKQSSYETHTALNCELQKIKDEQMELYKKLDNCREKLLDKTEKLLNKTEKLLDKTEEIHGVEKKLNSLERVLENLHKKHLYDIQMVRLRCALELFEKSQLQISENRPRPEEYMRFFRKNKRAVEAIKKAGFNIEEKLRKTVLSLCTRLNDTAHESHDVSAKMELQEECFTPSEQKLLKILWELSPLRQGTLVLRRAED